MKKKRNNKGFSLVELIVVMAIMAILAVTLAPRLIQYVDKARQGNDRELMNNLYTTVQYALLEDTVYSAAINTALDADGVAGAPYTIRIFGGKDGFNINNGATPAVASTDDIYDVSTNGKTWTAVADMKSNAFVAELQDVIGNFKLQSNKVTAAPQISIIITDQRHFEIKLDYDTTSATTFDYELNSTNAS